MVRVIIMIIIIIIIIRPECHLQIIKRTFILMMIITTVTIQRNTYLTSNTINIK